MLSALDALRALIDRPDTKATLPAPSSKSALCASYISQNRKTFHGVEGSHRIRGRSLPFGARPLRRYR